MKIETTTTGATKAGAGAKRKHDPAADARAKLRARMLELCVALGHVEIIEDAFHTGDLANDIFSELSEVAKQYATASMKD